MTILEWKDLLRVGHKTLDRQHLELFDIVNDLCDGIRQGRGASVRLLGNTIARLCDYASIHFVAEEQMMADVDYPDFQRHKRAHDGLVSMLEELEARLRYGDSQMATQILSFLMSEWLGHHIVIEDKRFAVFVAARAEKAESPFYLADDGSWLLPAECIHPFPAASARPVAGKRRTPDGQPA